MTEPLTQVEGSDVRSGARFSEDGLYRYRLWRCWAESDDPRERKLVTFVGLNPSIADADVNDPTITRCIGYAKRWGYDSLRMVNLYARISTDPKHLALFRDPIGPDNDVELEAAREDSDLVIACWGASKFAAARASRVVASGVLGDYHVIALSKDGCPRHPLYLRKDLTHFPAPRG